MTDWTPESTEYLEGYLKQVSALTQHQGDDADDIVPELREHIVRETEDAAGSLVTLEHLRKVLAAVGTPEQVAGGEGIPPVMGDAAHGVPQRRETPPPVPPRAAPPQPIIVQHKSSSFTKGCIIAVVVLVLCALGRARVLDHRGHRDTQSASLADGRQRGRCRWRDAHNQYRTGSVSDGGHPG